jgi:predicted nucleic acid-binding protein
LSRSSLTRAIPAQIRLLLDSSSLIAYLNGNEPASVAAAHVIDDLVRSGRNHAVISMITVLDVLVRPLQTTPADYAHALDFVSRFPNFTPQPIDLAVAQEGAGQRARTRLPTPDALIIATGAVAQVGLLVCNDERWKKIKDLRFRVLYLGDHLPW